MKNSLDTSLLDTGAAIKRGYSLLIENVGKTVAFITGVVVTLVTFTEIGFSDFRTASYATTVATVLLAAYIIYFSLEDAGEKLGRESDGYLRSEEKYKAARERLLEADISKLRGFLASYSKEELAFRRRSYLFTNGISEEEYNGYLSGAKPPRATARIIKKAMKMKPQEITPKQLLSKERFEGRGELVSPEHRKIGRLIVKLIPSTVCMIFTVSLVLAAKEGMTREFIIESILKLSALPIIGLRGYAEGYRYAKDELPPWLDTKTRLINAFFEEG